jgi:hypothetical protein
MYVRELYNMILSPDITGDIAPMHHAHSLSFLVVWQWHHTPENPNPPPPKRTIPQRPLPLHLSGYYPPLGIHHMVAAPLLPP